MAESQPTGQPPWRRRLWHWLSQLRQVSWWRRHWLAMTVLGLIVLLAYAVLAATVLPSWVVSLSGSGADENHRLDAIASARGALLGVLAPLMVALGAVAAFLNYRETTTQNARSYELSRREQVTDRLNKDVTQLASNELAVRLGGIYELEEIAAGSRTDIPQPRRLHRPIMDILTGFLREHATELARDEAPAASVVVDKSASHLPYRFSGHRYSALATPG